MPGFVIFSDLDDEASSSTSTPVTRLLLEEKSDGVEEEPARKPRNTRAHRQALKARGGCGSSTGGARSRDTRASSVFPFALSPVVRVPLDLSGLDGPLLARTKRCCSTRIWT
jgi:hypothetical protein